MLPRPRVRIPLWVALVVPAAAYAVRSAMRGFDFRPDLPTDAVALVALLVVVGSAAWVRAEGARDDTNSDPVAIGDEQTGPASEIEHGEPEP